MATYDFSEVVAHTGATPNRVQRWCDAGIIQTGGGGSQGKRRAFTFRNLVEVSVCDDLRGLGVGEPHLRNVVVALNAIWDQPDDLMFPDQERADKPTFRNMTILWISLQRDAGWRDGVEGSEWVGIYPIDAAELTRIMTGRSDFAETGIAVPIARLIGDLERLTGEIFDLREYARRKMAEALAKDQDK